MAKRNLIKVLLIFIAVLGVVTVPVNAAGKEVEGQTTHWVYLRQGTTTETAKICRIEAGKKVVLIGNPVKSSDSNGDRQKIKYNSKTGYVLAKYVKPVETNKSSDKKASVSEQIGVTTIALNMRKGKTVESSKICRIPAGKKVTVLGKKVSSSDGKGDRYKIKYNGKVGYVLSKYVSLQQNKQKWKLIATSNNVCATNQASYHNMKQACKYLNGKIVSAGESWSWYDKIGKATVEKGYISSTVFNGGNNTGIGGGSCRVVTTLYNAIENLQKADKKAGRKLEINVLEVHPHEGGSVAYAPAGHNATIWYPNKDFCFKNCTEYEIKIEAFVENGNKCTVNLYKKVK